LLDSVFTALPGQFPQPITIRLDHDKGVIQFIFRRSQQHPERSGLLLAAQSKDASLR
jgi:hypothetical protein